MKMRLAFLLLLVGSLLGLWWLSQHCGRLKNEVSLLENKTMKMPEVLSRKWSLGEDEYFSVIIKPHKNNYHESEPITVFVEVENKTSMDIKVPTTAYVGRVWHFIILNELDQMSLQRKVLMGTGLQNVQETRRNNDPRMSDFVHIPTWADFQSLPPGKKMILDLAKQPWGEQGINTYYAMPGSHKYTIRLVYAHARGEAVSNPITIEVIK